MCRCCLQQQMAVFSQHLRLLCSRADVHAHQHPPLLSMNVHETAAQLNLSESRDSQ
ncbi:hypothetical protein FQA47_019528, partial [Oryzias melastigma]